MSGPSRLTREHLSDVAELERLCFVEPWSESSLALLTGESGVGYVALSEGRAVAYAGMLCVLDEGQITNVATHPDYRRRGYAREVVLALLEYARKNGISSVSLEVRDSNTGAIELYSSLGFCGVGRRRNFYKRPLEDAVIMEYRV